MNKKSKFPYLMFLITIAILFLIPNHVVWGGHSFQTVPTFGPSRTPTKTKIITSTQSINTQTPSIKVTAAKSKTSPTMPTLTSTIVAKQLIFTKTTRPENTETGTPTNSSLEPENTTVVILPIISNEGDWEDQSNQGELTAIPAFVFPLVVVTLFVLIYMSTRLILRKSNNKNSNHSKK